MESKPLTPAENKAWLCDLMRTTKNAEVFHLCCVVLNLINSLKVGE